MFEPHHIFDTRGPANLNPNPACQELQMGLKKGPKMASEAISNLNFLGEAKDPPTPPSPAAACISMQSHTLPDQFNFASAGPVFYGQSL